MKIRKDSRLPQQDEGNGVALVFSFKSLTLTLNEELSNLKNINNTLKAAPHITD